MSQWTNIRGCLELSGTELIKNPNRRLLKNKYYLPYPEEQVKLSAPYPSYPKQKQDRGIIKYDVYVYSLPRHRETIEKAMKLLPSGEYNIINYNLDQPKYRFSLSSNSLEPWETEVFEKLIIDTYKEQDNLTTYEEIEQEYNIEFGFVEYAKDFTLTISDNIRDCSSERMLVSLEKAIELIRLNKIDILTSYLNWTDDCSKYEFNFKAENDKYTFSIHDPQTGTILASKQYNSFWNKKLNDFDYSITQTDNWYEFIPESLYEEESND